MRNPEPPAEEMPAGDAACRADLATTDLESMTDDELRRMLGSGPVCRFAYSSGEAAVAAATAPGAGESRGVITLHGRLVPMAVRYQTLAAEGFELPSDDVRVVAAPYEGSGDNATREAEAHLQIGRKWMPATAGSTSARDSGSLWALDSIAKVLVASRDAHE